MVYLWTLLAVLFFGLFGWQVTRADPQPHFIAINAVAYLGRVPQTVLRNQREACDPVMNLVKAAAVIVAAIEAELVKQP